MIRRIKSGRIPIEFAVMGAEGKPKVPRGKKGPNNQNHGKKGKKKVKIWSNKRKSVPEEVIIERLRSQYKKVKQQFKSKLNIFF